MRMQVLLISAVSLAGCASVEAPTHEIEISRTIVSHVVRATPGMETAAYAAFDNRGPADRLVAVHCECAERVEIHHMVGEGDARQMVVEPVFDIPADSRSAIEPPGLEWHLMLRDVRHPIPEGSQIEMTLIFENAGPQTHLFTAVNGTRAAWEAFDR